MEAGRGRGGVEQVRLIKPDYKDVAAQLDRAQHQREVLREYHDLAEAVRQTQATLRRIRPAQPHLPGYRAGACGTGASGCMYTPVCDRHQHRAFLTALI
jgi:hypothetical protein